ncbi:MAG: MFS transporter [Anaerolineae bacterium]|nr:MFS transporter [Anaerolineae bacterium]
MQRDREYWLVAGGYALIFGAMALVEPYLVPHLLGLGLSGTEVGNLMAVVNLIGLLFIPLASSAADRSGRHRRITVWSTLLQAAAALAMGLLTIPLLVGAAVIPFRYFTGLGMTARNRLALAWLQARNSRDYGSLRLWGSLGFAGCVVIGGVVAQRAGVPLLFVASAAVALASLALLQPFAAQLPTQEQRRREGRPSPVLVLLLLVIILMSLSRAAYNGWVQDFIQTGLGGGQSAVGLYMALVALIEVPVMAYEHHLVQKWGSGTTWALGLILVAAGFWLFSLVQTVPQALLLALPMGVSQGFTIVAPVVLIGQVSRPHNTTLNLALAGVLGNLGTLIGSPIAGRLFDAYGVRTLLQVGALGMFLTLIVLVGGLRLAGLGALRPEGAGR